MGDFKSIIEDIKAGDEPRRLFRIPVILCLEEIDEKLLLEVVRSEGLTNHLGYLVDLCLEREFIPKESSRFQLLTRIRDQLYEARSKKEKTFYPCDIPALVKHKLRNRTDLLRKWSLIAILDENKFEEVYRQENAYRQR
ncbi:hypothetical protein ACFLZN_01135 [Nanoarchaeota archaeon]